MAKKKTIVVSEAPEDKISSLGFRVIGAGAFLVVAGFVVLWFSDPLGRNWASHLSPFLIVGGYVAIGLGIIAPEKTI
jgi:hypothetical protein